MSGVMSRGAVSVSRSRQTGELKRANDSGVAPWRFGRQNGSNIPWLVNVPAASLNTVESAIVQDADLLDAIGDEAKLGKRVGKDNTHEKNTFLCFYSVEEAKQYADRLTEEAIRAISGYSDSDALVALAGWLAGRNH